MQRFLLQFSVCFSLGITLCSHLQAESIPDVSAKRLLNDVKALSSDEMEGRGVGTRGLDLAADFIAQSFEKSGLKVAVSSEDFFQPFEVGNGVELGNPNRLELMSPNGDVVALQYDQDFRTCSFGGSGEFDAPIVFAGYGISSEEAEYDDFASVDVKGKVVVLIRRNPFQNDPQGAFAVAHGISRHAGLTSKLSQAYQRGAVAVLLVNDVTSSKLEQYRLDELKQTAEQEVLRISQTIPADGNDATAYLKELREAVEHLQQTQQLSEQNNTDSLIEFGYGGTRSGQSVPFIHITQEAADMLLSQTLGKSLSEIEQAIDESRQPLSAELEGWKARGEATVLVQKETVKNVIGVLEGEGPLSHETIVVGAHFDHLGWGGEGSLTPGVKEIHNGADDNASGTSGMLELARRLGSRSKPLPRRVVFIGFTAEERGLLGSVEYVKNPLYPLEQTIAMFNLDMIGRLEENRLTVFGSGTSSRWEQLLDASAEKCGLTLVKKPEGFGPSDHSSFYGKKIPVLHLFTGIHSDYHRPSDDWEKVNVTGIKQIVDLLEQIVVQTAKDPQRPDYIEIKQIATVNRTGSRPYFGSIPDFGTEIEGYAIQGVTAESPAEKGGLKAGDVIIRLGDNKIGSLDDFDLALRNFSAGESIDLVVLREGSEVNLKVTLGASRG